MEPNKVGEEIQGIPVAGVANTKPAPVPNTPKPAPKSGRIFTYVGGGEDSPRVIDFMGMQKFVRGQATGVIDPRVLAKIADNPTFVEGEISQESLHDYDTKASAEAAAQRKKDEALNRLYQKNYKTE